MQKGNYLFCDHVWTVSVSTTKGRRKICNKCGLKAPRNAQRMNETNPMGKDWKKFCTCKQFMINNGVCEHTATNSFFTVEEEKEQGLGYECRCMDYDCGVHCCNTKCGNKFPQPELPTNSKEISNKLEAQPEVEWNDSQLNQLACDMFDRDFEIIPEKRQKLITFISTLLAKAKQEGREEIINKIKEI